MRTLILGLALLLVLAMSVPEDCAAKAEAPVLTETLGGVDVADFGAITNPAARLATNATYETEHPDRGPLELTAQNATSAGIKASDTKITGNHLGQGSKYWPLN